MSTRYNNRKIILSEQTLPIGKILPGMIVTFNYSESGVTDPRPLLLFLHRNIETKLIEGLNLNYLNPSKLKKLFQVIEFKKGKIDSKDELITLQETYFRVQISSKRKRTAMTTERFYSSVVGGDNAFKQAYRSYKTTKLSALKVTNIKLDMVGASED